jgi:hypothetical protein
MKTNMMTERRVWAGVTILLLCWGGRVWLSAAPLPPTAPTDYEAPKFLLGNVYTMGSAPRTLLYQSTRTAERSGTTVRAKREYTYPDGKLAARERVVYEAGQLVSVEEEKLQTGEHGTAVVRVDPKHPGKRRLFFEYTLGPGGGGKKSAASEALAEDTLVGDMIAPFIAARWDTLMQGVAAKFRYVALSRQETVGFKLVKESETIRQGKPTVRIRMEPTSFIIAQLVDPLFFIVEKDGAHRVLEYIGRTTPLLKDGTKWKDLDADTVYEWAPPAAGPSQK